MLFFINTGSFQKKITARTHKKLKSEAAIQQPHYNYTL